MTDESIGASGRIGRGDSILLRHVAAEDLPRIAGYPFTVSITAPLDDLAALNAAFAAGGFWSDEAGAAAIVDAADGRLLGTAQFYRSAPCIHGLEIGYIVHDPADRGRGVGTQVLRLIGDHLFASRPKVFRLQLVIEAWNVASWRLAERCGYAREGLMRSAGFEPDGPADCFLYARTRRDWESEHGRPVSLGG